jgi:glycosyltransferase involved in cell wall biosynthesis
MTPDTPGPVRTLVVSTEYPWPANSGSRLRLATALHALSRCGPVDLFTAVPDHRTDFGLPPADVALRRVHRMGVDDRPADIGTYLGALGRPSVPFEMAVRSRTQVTRALHDFATERYDLVWYFQAHSWVLSGGRPVAPSVVDLVDAENQKVTARALLAPRTATGRGHLRRVALTAWTAEDVRRWQRLHRHIARRASAMVVCSELDAERSGVAGIRVIGNDYPSPDDPVGRTAVASPPVVVFQGTLRYPPNADAARFLVEDVGPPLRALVPGAQIRLVGLTSPALSDLDDPPSVTLVGQVPDITDELRRADVIVIPLRYGSGTRIKILEAFAHRIPVVSTTMGAEGLGAHPGTHLLVADGPDDIAAACARLLDDDGLRRAVVEEAYTLFMTRYRSSVVEQDIAALASEIAGGAS